MTIGVSNNQFTPSTSLTLYKGVPIDGVTNTFWGTFSTKDEQKEFFDNNYEHKTFTEFTYQRRDGVVNVEANYDEIRAYNYMIYDNYTNGKKSRKVYAFINSIGYVSDFVSSIDFETDVIQTYRFEIEKNFMPSMVAYEHRPQYYKNSEGRTMPCINTQSEDLETGTDLYIQNQSYLQSDADVVQRFAVIKMTSDLDGNDATSSLISGAPSQFNYYVFPFDSLGSGFFNSITSRIKGSGVTTTALSVVYESLRSSESLVNKCAGVALCPAFPSTKVGGDGIVDFNSDSVTAVTTSSGWTVLQYHGGPDVFANGSITLDNWQHSKTWDLYGSDVFNVSKYGETKLYSYPFTLVEVTDNAGTTKAYKPELFQDYKMEFIISGSPDDSGLTCVPLNYKTNYTSADPNKNKIFQRTVDGFVNSFDYSAPVVSDYTAAMMQSSRNALNASLSNSIRSSEASFKGAKLQSATALKNAHMQYNTSLATSKNTLENTRKVAGLQLRNDNVGLWGQTMTHLPTYLSQPTNPDMYKDGRSLYSESISTATRTAEMTMRNAVNTQQNANIKANATLASSINSANAEKKSAKYTYKANIQNAYDSYNAQINDASATADSIVSSGGNAANVFNLRTINPVVMFYSPSPEYCKRLATLFKVRGYATNFVKVPNFKTRERWNYVQTVNAFIKADGIEAQDLENIKTAFNNGITLWHTADIYNYNNSNNDTTSPDTVDKYGNPLG